MRKIIAPAICAATLLLSGASTAVLSQAYAYDDGSVDFDTFHDQLAPYGDWVYSDRWGEVWIPEDVSDDFHPYGTGGHWVYTNEYGWYWVSNYEWGDIPFHYGRWVNDPDDGWLWIPGYVWGPGWVVWRSNGDYTGWMPMPPDDEFLGRRPEGASIGISVGNFSINFGHVDDYYGYSRWYGRDYDQDRFASNWLFIGTAHMGDRDYHRWSAPRTQYVNIIHNTTNITNYTVVNNYYVNKSVDPRMVARAGGRNIQPVRFADVVSHPKFIMPADKGLKVQTQMRTLVPRGTGVANSAPPPTPKVLQTLSPKLKTKAGHQPPPHLFTRENISNAPLGTGGAMMGGPNGKLPNNGMSGGPMGAPSGDNAMGPANGMDQKGKHHGGIDMKGPSGAMGPGGAMAPGGTMGSGGAMGSGGTMGPGGNMAPAGAGNMTGPASGFEHKGKHHGGAMGTDNMGGPGGAMGSGAMGQGSMSGPSMPAGNAPASTMGTDTTLEGKHRKHGGAMGGETGGGMVGGPAGEMSSPHTTAPVTNTMEAPVVHPHVVHPPVQTMEAPVIPPHPPKAAIVHAPPPPPTTEGAEKPKKPHGHPE